MKKAEKIVLIIIAVIILFSIPIKPLTELDSCHLEKEAEHIVIPANLESHEPIIIESDSDFENQSWPGSGKQEDPYLIEGLFISNASSCVNVTNTRKYAHLSNCMLTSPVMASGFGILLQNVTNFRVTNCTIISKDRGAYLVDVHNSAFEESNVSESNRGVQIYSSRGLNVTKNNLSNCEEVGIYTSVSRYIRIQNNLVMNCGAYGIRLAYSYDCVVTTSTFDNNTESGLAVEYSSRIVLENNTVEGSQIGCRAFSCSSLQIQNTSVMNCDRIGLQVNDTVNIGLEHNSFHGNRLWGATLYSSNYVSVAHSFFTNNTNGLLVSICESSTILNSSIIESTHEALKIAYSEDIEVRYCEAIDTERYGIHITYSTDVNVSGSSIAEINKTGLYIYDATEVTVSDVTMTESNNSLYVGLSSNISFSRLSLSDVEHDGIRIGYSSNVLVADCRALSCEGKGVALQSVDECRIWRTEVTSCGEGIRIVSSQDVSINQSKITNTQKSGIHVRLSSRLFIEDNIIQKCGLFGLDFEYSYDSTLSNNQMKENQFCNMFLARSGRVQVRNNSLLFSRTGLYVLHTSSSDIKNNSISKNGENGLYLGFSNANQLKNNRITSSGGYALQLFWSDFNHVNGNEIRGNRNGIYLYSSENNTLTKNIISDNTGVGLHVAFRSSNNTIYQNLFSNNSQVNAIDEGKDNQWDDRERRGNIWDNAIEGFPYLIPGHAWSIDRFPEQEVAFPKLGLLLLLTSLVVISVILVATGTAMNEVGKSNPNQ